MSKHKHKHRKERQHKGVEEKKTRGKKWVLVPVKLKGKPRGKSFEKGNKFGQPNWFPPGIAHPRHKRVHSDLCARTAREVLASRIPGDYAKRTFAKGIMDRLAWGALMEGKERAAEILMNRAEGLPQQNMALSGPDDPIVGLLNEMRKESKKRGRPEGYVEPKDKASDSDDE